MPKSILYCITVQVGGKSQTFFHDDLGDAMEEIRCLIADQIPFKFDFA